jgi:hypothetical protein
MTIALKLSVAYTSYKRAVKQYAAQGREAVVVSCINCRQGYVLFPGPEMSDSEAQQWFYHQAKRDHPHKADGFSIGEPFPEAKELALGAAQH